MRPLVDGDERDPFDFSVPDQHRQLVAGWHRTTESNGLVVTMPDHDDLIRGRPRLRLR